MLPPPMHCNAAKLPLLHIAQVLELHLSIYSAYLPIILLPYLAYFSLSHL